ncbi:hypothetical protein TNIN_20101 [Trichonephila inaurata madagascariensis]|uniref:Uncharacterized protein n=1 Tax=Trichonephila inaurata madagascariensis TaxID=2747483 RepID=A0A8X7CRK7_9ARAC|nr:hypothetical protein TNIN_20101 [Trichonephila inaurata madagascariensis]
MIDRESLQKDSSTNQRRFFSHKLRNDRDNFQFHPQSNLSGNRSSVCGMIYNLLNCLVWGEISNPLVQGRDEGTRWVVGNGNNLHLFPVLIIPQHSAVSSRNARGIAVGGLSRRHLCPLI